MIGKGVRRAAETWRERWFPERQIVLRQGHRVSALTLTTRAQSVLVGVLAGLCLVALTSSGLYLWQRHQVAKAKQAAAGARKAYAALLEEVSGQHGKMRGLVAELERSREELLALLDQGEAGTPVAQGAQMSGWLKRLGRELTGLNEEAASLNADVAQMRGQSGAPDDKALRFSAAREAIERRIDALEAQLTEEQRRAGELQRALSAKVAAAERAERERRAAEAEKKSAAERAAAAETQLADAKKEHDAAFDALNRRAKESIAAVERLVGPTGPDPRRGPPAPPVAPAPVSVTPAAAAPAVLPTAPAGASSADSVVRRRAGGPFVPWRPETPRAGAASLPPKAAETAAALDRLDQLGAWLRTTPIAAPVRAITLSSRFGYRHDPFNGRPAMHEGLDLLGAPGTPILATADGVVVSAGWRNDYGWVVEIDHGGGLHSRYAHMRKLLVVDGQTVRQRDQIGEMGSTGRAEATHLHYEIRVSGRAVDPAAYMKVLNPHVLQN